MKYFKIIVINFLIIILLLVVADYSLFFIEKKNYLRKCAVSQGFFNPSYIVHYAQDVPYSFIPIHKERQIINNTNRAILLTGCSFTYGSNLSPTQNFSYYLAKETGLTVYNWGIEGGSIQHVLYLSQAKDFIKDYPNVDLIVYTFIDDHLNRLNEFLKCEVYCPYCNFRMEKKDGKYVPMNEWYAVPSKVFLFRMILKAITKFKNSNIFYEKNSKQFVEMVNQTKRNLLSYYPDAKFIFLLYFPYEKKEWMNDFDEDIIVMTAFDYVTVNLLDKKYIHKQ